MDLIVLSYRWDYLTVQAIKPCLGVLLIRPSHQTYWYCTCGGVRVLHF